MNKGHSVGEFKSKFNPDPEVVHLREENKRLQERYDKEREAHGELRETLSDLRLAVVSAKPVPMVYKETKKSVAPCTHVLHLTDLHYGEVTKADEVDGFGAYSPEIAEAALTKLGNAILKKTRVQREGYNVPHLHILGTGDYISGDIHQELQVTNAFPCPVQAVRCGYALGALLEMFAPHFQTVTADMVTLDNHGRITHKHQAAEGGLNNWGYVVAQVMTQYCKALPNVKVNIHAKPSALVHIGPESYLIFHGHQMKGWAGKPYYGFDRRVALEAVKRMGVQEQTFTKLVFGHYHTGTNEKDWQLGGSLSGTNAFDHGQGRHSKPHQTAWFVHAEHGEFDWTRWWV